MKLIDAIRADNVEETRKALKKVKDINADLAGGTVVEALLDAGADATLTDPNGSDALRIFLREYEDLLAADVADDEDKHWQNKQAMARQIHQRLKAAGAKGPNPENEALLKAAIAGDVDALRAALHRGADVSARNVHGGSALGLAASGGHAEAVRALLDAGADVNDAGRTSTPVIAAAQSGHLKVVKLLVEAGADIHHTRSASETQTALVLARINRKDEVVRYLKSIGATFPLPKDWKPPEPGVAMWENFEDLLVKADADAVAKAIGRIIAARQVVPAAYGRQFDWEQPVILCSASRE